jgi:hypothetical protein
MPQRTVRSIATEFPPPPRIVQRTVGSGCALAFPRLFVLPHMIIGIMLLLYAPVRLYVERFGTPAVATIDRHEFRTGSKGGKMYLIYYHVIVDGRRYDEYRSVSNADFISLHDGDKLQGRTSPLLYLSIRFQDEHFVGPPAWSDGPLIIPFLVSIAWNGGLAVFVFYYWIIPIRQRRLVRFGSAAPGLIESIEQRAKGRLKLTYSFTTAERTSLIGSQTIEKGTSASAGMPCTVFYDPKKPGRNVAYECSGLRIVGS